MGEALERGVMALILKVKRNGIVTCFNVFEYLLLTKVLLNHAMDT